LVLQIVVDVLVLAWIYLWYRVGVAVHDAVTSAASVGYQIRNSAGGVAGSLDQAGQSMANAPFIGNSVSGPLRTAAQQIAGVAGSGRTLGDRLTGAAGPAGWLVTLAPILVVLAFWLPARWRFARRAGAAADLAQAPAGQELLALRALVHRPLQELEGVTPDPLGAVRSGNPEAVRALAGLELVAAGVRRPAPDRTTNPAQERQRSR
jgi:hypothetical protein